MTVRLQLLGPPGVERAGSSRPVRLDRPISLLVYLAVREGWVTRSELAFLYRPDEPEMEALRYLRKLVYRARRIPWSEGLEVTEAGLRWRVDNDVARFRSALAAGDFASAVASYGGSFLASQTLPGAPAFAAWHELQRHELETGWSHAARNHAAALGRAGRHEEVARLLEHLLARDPLDEDALHAYLRALAAGGRRGDALRAYDRFSRTLAEEVGGIPLEATQALADGIRRSPAEATGPPTSARYRLPAPATRFVGREDALARVVELLSGAPPRLVTLVGLGGSGKTRLALEAGARAAPRFADGVLHVSLAATRSADRVAADVVERLGLPWVGASAEEALASGLAEARLLLLLDEFESVVDAAPLLVRTLERARGVVILVTSREALEVRGEHIVDVAGLEVPAADEARDLAGCDAVRLFVQCATRVAPDFVLTRANLLAIAEICRTLEGMPLAIELASSWARTLHPEALQAELARNADILTTRLRDVPARHRSLWTVFDYTCTRLPAAAKAALPKLTVFRGGFTPEAAEHVAGAGLEVLLALMNRTLVRRRGDGRYAMHALVRQYSLRGAAPRDHARVHARFFADLLVALTPDLKGDDPVGALAKMNADFANIEAAWDHAVATADVDLLEDCREALDHYWHYRSRWREAAAAFGHAVAALERGTLPARAARLRARLLVHLAGYERVLGEVDSARRHAGEALADLERYGSAPAVLHARLELASSAFAASRYEAARAEFERVLEAAARLSDRYLEGAAHNGLANVLCATRGDMATAERHYRASLGAHRAIGNLEGVNGALINLGACRYDLQDFAEAGRLWSEAAEIAARLGYVQREAVLHNNLGSLAEVVGERDAARDHYARSLSLRQEIGDRPGIAKVLHNLGRLAHGEARFDHARSQLLRALELLGGLEDRGEEAAVRSSLARTLASLDRMDEAEEQSALALRLAHDAGARSDMLGALTTRAELRFERGDPEAALRLALYVAHEADGSDGVLRARAVDLAEAAEAALNPDHARRVKGELPAHELATFVAAELCIAA